jgi:hypothetical protein
MKVSLYAALLGAGLIGSMAFALAAEAKTAKECASEWTANKSTLQAAGKTRRVFMAECRGVTASTSRTLAKGQYASEAEAKTSCPADTVVWVNLRTKVFHTSDSASYGKTKRGAYMCKKETTAVGYKASTKRAAAQ